MGPALWQHVCNVPNPPATCKRAATASSTYSIRGLPLRPRPLRLPEHHFPLAAAVQRAVRLADVAAGGEELAASAQHVGDLVVRVLLLQQVEIEPPRVRVELQKAVAEVIRLSVAADGRAVVGAQLVVT